MPPFISRTSFKRGIVTALGACAAAPAFAQPVESPWYAGIAVGQSQFKQSCDGVAIGCDDTDTGWKIFGGYQFTRHLGAELGYVDLGNAEANGTGIAANTKAKGWELLGVGTLPVSERFAAYGKAGIFRWDADSSASIAVPGFARAAGSASETGTDFTFGVGLKYDFAQNMSARLEWQRYNDVGKADTTGQSDIEMVSVGLALGF